MKLSQSVNIIKIFVKNIH